MGFWYHSWITNTSVFHWTILDQTSLLQKTFDHHATLTGAQIINHRVTSDKKWLILIWISGNRGAEEWENRELLWAWLCQCHCLFTTPLWSRSVKPYMDCYTYGNWEREEGFRVGKVKTWNGCAVVWWRVEREELWVWEGMDFWSHWRALWLGARVPHFLAGLPPLHHYSASHSSLHPTSPDRHSKSSSRWTILYQSNPQMHTRAKACEWCHSPSTSTSTLGEYMELEASWGNKDRLVACGIKAHFGGGLVSSSQ